MIVGSRIIQLMEAKDNFISLVSDFIKRLRHVLDELPEGKSYEGMVLVTGYFLLVKTNVAHIFDRSISRQSMSTLTTHRTGGKIRQ